MDACRACWGPAASGGRGADPMRSVCSGLGPDLPGTPAAYSSKGASPAFHVLPSLPGSDGTLACGDLRPLTYLPPDTRGCGCPTRCAVAAACPEHGRACVLPGFNCPALSSLPPLVQISSPLTSSGEVFVFVFVKKKKKKSFTLIHHHSSKVKIGPI